MAIKSLVMPGLTCAERSAQPSREGAKTRCPAALRRVATGDQIQPPWYAPWISTNVAMPSLLPVLLGLLRTVASTGYGVAPAGLGRVLTNRVYRVRQGGLRSRPGFP